MKQEISTQAQVHFIHFFQARRSRSRWTRTGTSRRCSSGATRSSSSSGTRSPRRAAADPPFSRAREQKRERVLSGKKYKSITAVSFPGKMSECLMLKMLENSYKNQRVVKGTWMTVFWLSLAELGIYRSVNQHRNSLKIVKSVLFTTLKFSLWTKFDEVPCLFSDKREWPPRKFGTGRLGCQLRWGKGSLCVCIFANL